MPALQEIKEKVGIKSMVMIDHYDLEAWNFILNLIQTGVNIIALLILIYILTRPDVETD